MVFKKLSIYMFLAIAAMHNNVHCLNPMLKQFVLTKNSKKIMEALSKNLIPKANIKGLQDFIDQEIEKTKLECKSFLPGKKDCYKILIGSAFMVAAYYLKPDPLATDEEYFEYFARTRPSMANAIRQNPKAKNLSPNAINITSSWITSLGYNNQRLPNLLKSVITKSLRAICIITGSWMIIKGLLKSNNRHMLNELDKIKKAVSAYDAKISNSQNKAS